MSTSLKIAAAIASLAAMAMAPAQAQSFSCLSGNSVASCNQAVAGVTWSLAGSLLTINNAAAGSNVAEVYFDTTGPMSVSLSSVTGTVNLVGGALPNSTAPSELPSGNNATPDFDTTFSWDSGSGSTNGINFGESATFALSGASITDLLSGSLRVGLHVRGLVNDQSESLITSPPVAAIPEPGVYALMLAGLGALGFVVRRRRPG